MKKISIVIPVYNAENYIVRCLDSVKSQSYQDFEIVLINDRSTDNTLEVLTNYQTENKNLDIRIWTNEKNSGPSISRNFGMDNAKGSYIFFMDADDDFADDLALQSFIDKTEGNPDIVFGENHFFVDAKLTQSKYHTLENKKDV
ncbi:glycosyltransferase family 2 protein, partial [Epilithonimonas hominis]